MLTIIAGEKSGFQLKSPENIRPILARIKKSIFDIIKLKISGATFLDLFAGSGSIGLEALSRGANRCVFVEKENLCISVLYENINFLQYKDKSYVIQADILKDLFWIDKIRKYLETNNLSGFDIIFIGAPYFVKNVKHKFKTTKINSEDLNLSYRNKKLSNMCSTTIKLVYNSEILNKDGLVIVQHSIKEDVNFYKFKVLRNEKYGDTIVDFLKL